ncbi:hypothetical protein [Candidatus Magnetomonas plexicatena]|uniref:hypothetical protein n=1 Tax=Candidatus Magnetomonas plexicatena TaxID=2552947 RepID=UPI00110519D9|nr:hypothetical protein E2O03_011610 [Nitrospirales bacterium LBB_01]
MKVPNMKVDYKDLKKLLDSSVSGSVEILNESWLYTYASMEYSVLVVYSYVVRGGKAVGEPIAKIVVPIKGIAGPVSSIIRPVKDLTGKASKEIKEILLYIEKLIKRRSERLSSIEQRLEAIEKRLAYIEKHGITLAKSGKSAEPKKRIADSKKSFLKSIVMENVELRSEMK